MRKTGGKQLGGFDKRIIKDVVDGAFKFAWDESLGINGHLEHAHDVLSGKFAHGKDIFETEGRLRKAQNACPGIMPDSMETPYFCTIPDFLP